MLMINLFAVIVIISLLAYGLYKGSGNILFTGIIIALGGLLAHFIGLPFLVAPGADVSFIGICEIVIMLVFCIAAFPLGKYINQIFQISLEPFDFFPGLIFGGITAFIVLHFLLSFALLAFTNTPTKHDLERSFAVRHFVYYQFWKSFSSNFVGRYDSRPSDIPEE